MCAGRGVFPKGKPWGAAGVEGYLSTGLTRVGIVHVSTRRFEGARGDVYP